MKKIAIIFGGLLVVVIGVIAFLSMQKKSVLEAYWDGQSNINQIGTDGSLPLIRAVKAKDKDAVESLLLSGALLEGKDKDGQTALDVAIADGQVEIYKFLLGHEKPQPSHLVRAIANGQKDMVEFLLNQGIGVNEILEFTGRHRPDEVLTYEDPRTVTALKKAVEADKPEIARLLLEKGAEGAKFFLPQAISHNQVEMVKVLADKIPDVRGMVVRGMDLLSYAGNDANPEILKYFLSRNVGEANSGLQRVLVHRKTDNSFMETVDIFLEVGAVPSVDGLLIALKKNNQPLFEKLAGCLVEANVQVPNTDDDLLRYALKNGYAETVYYLLARGVDIWQLDKNGVSPLAMAVAMADKNPELYQHFKAKLKDINETGYNGESLLMLVAEAGNFKEFQEIAENGGDIWQKDKQSRSVLMYAAKGGNIQVINYLVSKGDNLSSMDSWGKTPLMYASGAGQVEAMRHIMDRGIDSKDLDSYGRSAIMYAAEGGHAKAVKLLLDAGETAFFTDDLGKSVLMFAAASGDAETIQVLLDRRADASASDKDNVSVISYAVQSNSVPAVKKILEQRVDIYAADKNGYQPATYAFKNGNIEIMKLLSPRIGSLRGQTKDNQKSLPMYAVEGGNHELMKKMVWDGTDWANLKDNKGQNFVMLLAKYGRPDAYRDLLHRRGINQDVADNNGKTVLMYAAESESGVNLINSQKDFIGRSVDVTDKEGKNAMMYALDCPYNLTIKEQTLVKAGADVNKADNNGKSVLMYAVGNMYNRVDLQIVRDLLKLGANPNKRDNEGRTPLMYAAASPYAGVGVIDLLLQAQANVKVKDNHGKTLLMYAVQSGNISKIKLLLEAGAVTGGQTNDGKSVMDFAAEKSSCFAEAVRKLIQK